MDQSIDGPNHLSKILQGTLAFREHFFIQIIAMYLCVYVYLYISMRMIAEQEKKLNKSKNVVLFK
jgi:hypothetical protein